MSKGKKQGSGGLWAVVVVIALAAGAHATGSASASPASGGVGKHLDDIGFCESSNNYQAVSKIAVVTHGKRQFARGRYQFLDTTWADYHTGYTHANDAPPAIQDKIAVKHHARYGDSPWLESKPCWSRR